jgi:hypothetical protein
MVYKSKTSELEKSLSVQRMPNSPALRSASCAPLTLLVSLNSVSQPVFTVELVSRWYCGPNNEPDNRSTD